MHCDSSIQNNEHSQYTISIVLLRTCFLFCSVCHCSLLLMKISFVLSSRYPGTTWVNDTTHTTLPSRPNLSLSPPQNSRHRMVGGTEEFQMSCREWEGKVWLSCLAIQKHAIQGGRMAKWLEHWTWVLEVGYNSHSNNQLMSKHDTVAH